MDGSVAYLYTLGQLTLGERRVPTSCRIPPDFLQLVGINNPGWASHAPRCHHRRSPVPLQISNFSGLSMPPTDADIVNARLDE
jgi:hypothetical protein